MLTIIANADYTAGLIDSIPHIKFPGINFHVFDSKELLWVFSFG